MRATFFYQTRSQIAVVLLPVMFGFGCTQPAMRVEPLAPEENACLIWYQKLDKRLSDYELIDPSTAKITGVPFLRANRFLATFRTQSLTDTAYAEWLERMRQLDASLRINETANLPPAAVNDVLGEAPLPGSLDRVLQQCGSRLVKATLRQPEFAPLFRQQIQIPDAYRSWQRIAGAYWLTQFPAKLALKILHKKLAESFTQQLDDLPVQGRLIRYAPAETRQLTANEITAMLRAAYQNPLGIPVLSGEELGRLFNHYAPIWEIDTRNDTDKIGEAVLNDYGEPRIDTRRPVVYQNYAYTRRQGRILLQLIYQIWLPARQKSGLTDLYGGKLDSVIWRITLSPEGAPIAYDSIHACGCYYLLFPGRHYRSISPTDGAEAVLSPKHIDDIKPGQRLLLRFESRTHYLLQTAISAQPGKTPSIRYQTRAYDALLSLPLPDGTRRSLFGPDGIIASSARSECFLLWPFGVPSPGAMRQWGVHAIALTGKRYFDDPYLFEHLLAEDL
ncbi:hypothetical protein [Methylomicrobium sp. Wu6]|uniref:hypothetical protein n=1 Tax=Methylomicrobium sp. Wu6 TaxID=3107928 RepID=UPI002DD64CF5|nr:hypothetical protein [Methylomicrobium sp. Wu6]MEC4749039.1 hypothetical protein [Methylomicrobium sp. Wu6]